MASALRISLCVFTLSITQASPQTYSTENPKMTILKEWSNDTNLNGEFEASRRSWLASIRLKRQLGNNDAVIIKKAELSKELIQKYADILNQEQSMP